MENAPVINLTFVNTAPGADRDTIERFDKWNAEVYQPIYMKVQGIMGGDRYVIIRKNPLYPSIGTIQHYENIITYENTLKSPERLAVIEDLNAWVRRGVREGIWSAAYELIQGYRADATSQNKGKETKIENAPIMHLEAYRLASDEQGKYLKWFNDNGRVFIPLFMKTCGLKGYDFLKYSGLGPAVQSRETDYPPYLSILYFEDMKAFEHFEESPEQVSFQSALRNVFPQGLNYKWYVQYQLTQSWRK